MDRSTASLSVLRQPRGFRPLWWMSPAAIIALLVAPMAIAVHFYTPEYIAVDRVFFGGFMLVLCLLGLLVFALAAMIASRAGQGSSDPEYSIEPRCLDLIGVIGIIAYLVWFRDILFHPALILDVISGSKTSLRDDIDTLPGITTLVQFGVCYAVLYSINLSYGEKLPRRHHLIFGLLGLLALFRSVMWSERLALVEYFLPFILFYFARINSPSRPALRVVLMFVPYISLVLSLTVFCVGEYFRSWKFFSDKNVDFFSFMLDRWVGYYFSSLNNGAALVSLSIDKIPDLKFFFTLNWFYQLPGIGPWLNRAMDVTVDPGQHVLDNYLNVEFNVFSGIFPVFFDFGIIIGLVFWTIAGLFFGSMYAGFTARRGIGLIIYPTLFIGLLELLRTGYFFSTRYVYVLVACLVAFAFFRRPRVPAAAERTQPLLRMTERRPARRTTLRPPVDVVAGHRPHVLESARRFVDASQR